MSSQSKQFKQRILSAKPLIHEPLNIRPMSGMSSQTYSRKELIQNVYTVQSQAGPSRTASAKALSHRVLLGLQQSKKIVVKQSKRKEELEQQILKLKQTINRLTEQLSHQKGKTQSIRKKSQKFKFENETHWNSSTLSSHLVAGIKNTYDSLKIKYDLLQEEHQLLLKKKNITKELEYITYIDVLQRENKALSLRLEKFSAPNLQKLIGTDLQREAAGYIIAELESDRQTIAEKYKQVEGRYQMCLETLKDRNKKIQFLEKLIVEKDNSSHTTYRQTKKLREEVITLKQFQDKLAKDLKNQSEQSSIEIQSLKTQLFQQKQSYDTLIFQKVQIKENKISELQKENQYLHQMSKQLRKTNSQLNKSVQQLKLRSKSQNVVAHDKKQQHFSYAFANQSINVKVHQKADISEQTTCRMQSFEGLFLNGKRVPQRADKKYHQNAQKKRKIFLTEITQISDLIKLKLINHKFSFSQIKKLFDSDPVNRKNQWEQQYITMREVKQILSFPPFSLPPFEAQVFARYLVEDAQTQYVYCDEFNQNNREVVKAIIKSLLEEYPICMENSTLENDVKRFMKNYESNLKSALEKLEPSGTISSKKFVDTLKILGMQCSQEVQIVLLGRMSSQAPSTNKLNYGALFN